MHDSNKGKIASPYFQGSPDFVAYIKDGTWWVRARYLNAKFTKAAAEPLEADRFTIRLQLLVYKELITKNIASPTPATGYDLGGTSGSEKTYVLPRPTGF